MNPIIESLKVIIELLRTGFTKVSISAELDDPNIAAIKTNTDNVITLLSQINSKMKTILVVTQAEYDLIDPKDPNTIYLITQDTQP